MRKYIIASNSGIYTTLSLKKKLKDVTLILVTTTGSSYRIRHYLNDKMISEKKSVKDPTLNISNSIIIRYGSTCPIVGTGNIIYNESRNIILSSNKQKARLQLLKSSVSCPRVYEKNFKRFPLVARPFKHSKGRDFNLLTNPRQLQAFQNTHPKGYYYSEFIDKEREFRVHCANGKILLVKEKPRPTNVNQPIWNIDANGEAFEYIPWEEYNSDAMFKVCIESLKATKELGLDFSAVDVMLKNNTAYVLEANTAPSLHTAEYTEDRYIKYFEFLFKNTKNTKLSNWDFSKFEKGSSLAWKNSQLNSQKNIINEKN